MAGTLTNLRVGLGNALSRILDLQVAPYLMANPTPPTAFVFPGGPAGNIEYDLTFVRGLDRYPFTVQVIVPKGTDIGAQELLDEYLAPTGARSVKAALEYDKTLGGVAQDVHVIESPGYTRFVTDGGSAVLGAEWHVSVLAVGT